MNVAAGSMPWQGDATEGDKARGDFKYQYHPGGDPRNPPKNAPSALHSVVVPNVNLPKVRMSADDLVFGSMEGEAVAGDVLGDERESGCEGP